MIVDGDLVAPENRKLLKEEELCRGTETSTHSSPYLTRGRDSFEIIPYIPNYGNGSLFS